jgi:hypothetical protein
MPLLHHELQTPSFGCVGSDGGACPGGASEYAAGRLHISTIPMTMQTEVAAFVAIDWADQKHVWALQLSGSSRRETGTIEHTPEALEAW